VGVVFILFSCFSECVSSRSEYFQHAAEEENSKLILLPKNRLDFWFQEGQLFTCQWDRCWAELKIILSMLSDHCCFKSFIMQILVRRMLRDIGSSLSWGKPDIFSTFTLKKCM